MLTGSCLCGDIAFEIDGTVDMMGHCHCSMCRKSHGGTFATHGTALPDQFSWVRGAERISTYHSSSEGYRQFCPRCGSAVPMSGEDQPFALVPMGNINEDPGTRPGLHWFTGSMAPWHTIVDDLPQHEAYPAEFGPDAVQVDRPVRKPKTENRKRRVPSEEAASAARSHSSSTTRRFGFTTATARAAGAP